MNGLALFARTRRWPLCLALILVTGLLIVACGPLSYTLNPANGYRVAAASQVPLLAALTVQGALTSPLPRQEQQAARTVAHWRLLHILGLSTIASAVVGTSALFIQPPAGVMLNAIAPLGPTALIRDLLAYTGLALTTGAILGPALGWLLPLAWVTIPAAALRPSDPDPTGLLRLPAQPDTALVPLVIGLALFALGTALALTEGRLPRPSIGRQS